MCQKIILTLVFFFFFVSFSNVEGVSERLPAPIDIDYVVEEISANDVKISLTVTPQEKMHVEIRLLVPREFQILKPFSPKTLLTKIQETRDVEGIVEHYEWALQWIGPLEANAPKEFFVNVHKLSSQPHSLFARIIPLAKWGEKELIINLQSES